MQTLQVSLLALIAVILAVILETVVANASKVPSSVRVLRFVVAVALAIAIIASAYVIFGGSAS